MKSIMKKQSVMKRMSASVVRRISDNDYGENKRKLKEDEKKMVLKRKMLKRDFGNTTISITFGDQAENHAGMQILGRLASEGFSHKDLVDISSKFKEKGCKCELIRLNDLLEDPDEARPAHLLVVRDGLAKLVDNNRAADKLYKEQRKLNFDKKAKMRGRVVNKHARWNLCFDETSQEPDYENGKGRAVAFSKCPKLSYVRDKLSDILGPKGKVLCAELNMYYDTTKCGIGFHVRSSSLAVFVSRLARSNTTQSNT